jgi:ligand-binding sensor domain-containing protein/signal transduction histidine kinase
VFLAWPQCFRLSPIGVLLGITLACANNAQLLAQTARSFSPDPFEVRPADGGWQPNSITAIVQTSDGYLWLGTYHGLVRFDGVSYTVFDSGNTPRLANGRITSLYEGPDHSLWIGHETGHVSRMSKRQFQSVLLDSKWPGGVVESISSDDQGDVWLLNDIGFLYRVRDGHVVRTPGGASATRRATLSRAKDGKLWVSSNGRIATVEQGNIVPVAFPEKGSNSLYERVFPAKDGGVWILANGCLHKWQAHQWTEQLRGFPTLPGSVAVVAEMHSGMLVGTMQEGLWMLRRGADPLHFSRTNGLSHDWIRTLLVDQEGNCWIGTGAGFDGLRPRKVRMVSPPDGWQGCAVRSFVVDSDETGWIGTEGAGLYRHEHAQWKAFGGEAGIYGLFIWSVLETKQRELFVGTWGAGVYRRKGHGFESPGELAKIKTPVAALYQGQNGELWIGTQEGLYRYEAEKVTSVAGKDKLILPDVRTITESDDGTLWFGMYGGGLGTLHNGTLKQFRHKDGLSSDLISCLYADSDGTLWIGTADNGVCRFANGKFSSVSQEHGLPSKVISHIVDDNAGHLWMGSQNGIVRVSKVDLHRCANAEAKTLHCLNYGRSEGLTAQSCSGGFQPGACRTSDGRLWFPTAKGLAVVDPANVTSNSVPPPVVIESLFVDGSPTNLLTQASIMEEQSSEPVVQVPPQRPNPSVRIPPGHQRFVFHFTGLSFSAPGKVRFRHMLEGLEDNWVETGTKRTAEYTFLPPGTYTFKATACNNDNLWNPIGASMTFTILPFFWQTWLFRIVSLVTGAGTLAASIFWAARLRLRRKLDQLERQRALERERTRIARDIPMLSQSVRGEVPAQTQAAADVDQIYSTAREITRAMDEIVWAVNPKYDTLDSLAAYLGRFAQQYLSGAGIRCRLHIPVQLPTVAISAEVRHNVFLAFKEALNNTVKHAGATEVSITLTVTVKQFALLLVDNGRGLDRKADSPSLANNLRSLAGNGLSNMQKRMDEIGGHLELDSAHGEGTRVTFRVYLQ